MAMTAVGIFDDARHARAAVGQLVDAGFDRGQISVLRGRARPAVSAARAAMADRMDPNAAAARTGVTPDFGMASVGQTDSAATLAAIDADPEEDNDNDLFGTGPHAGAATGAPAGAGVGAVIGGSLGVLTGAAALFIPGLGLALGIGPLLATILGGAGIGAVAGGLGGALANAGVPEVDAGLYAEGVRRGGTLVTVVASDGAAAERAADLLDAAGAYDVTERAATWSESTAPVGGNVELPALSTLPESAMMADRPVVTDAR
jgi:hypothetical protein